MLLLNKISLSTWQKQCIVRIKGSPKTCTKRCAIAFQTDLRRFNYQLIMRFTLQVLMSYETRRRKGTQNEDKELQHELFATA